MNILQILPELNIGGVETGTVDLAKMLIEDGHKAIVVSNGGRLVGKLEEFGARHYSLPVHKKSFFSIINLIPQLCEIIKKEEIQIVHARSRVPAWIAFFACLKTNTVFITTCHGYYKKHLFSWIMGMGKFVIANSDIIARHMRDDFRVREEFLRIIPRGVDLDKFKFTSQEERQSSPFVVGIVGRLTPLKGHKYFLKAMSKTLRAIPNLRVWVVGSADKRKANYKEELKALTRRLGISHCVDFLGYEEDIKEVLSKLSVLVMATTTQEAFGRVIIEAGASGVPVVATKVGGVIDIIKDQETGFLVAPSDSDAIHKSVMKLYNEPILANEFTKNLRQKVEQEFSLDTMYSSKMSLYNESLENPRILLIKLGAVGDVILSVPAFRAIREKFPKAKICCLTARETSSILIHCPYIDELIIYDYKNKDKGFLGLIKLIRSLIHYRFDFSIDLQNNRKSHIIAFFSLISKRYGFDVPKKFSFLLNMKTPLPGKSMSPLEHQFNILGLLGIKLENPSLELWPDTQDEDYINELLENEWLPKQKLLIGINIGASNRWQSKRWPLEYISTLCEELAKNDIRVCLTGTHDDLMNAKLIKTHAKEAKPVILCGKTNINQLACLMKKLSAYITGDSAPLHIATACKIPIIALFGPTDPTRHLVPSQKCTLIRKDLPCSPCYKSKCRIRSKKCMRLITVEEILRTLNKILV